MISLKRQEAQGTNGQYRDRLFKFIFGNPENKEWTLSLYNAVNDSNYTDASAIKFNTIEDAVYMGMKNDVSFLIGDTVSMYEHQSTLNPNMPMRFLVYAGMLYGKYIQQEEDYHRFSSALQKAPTPKCICFYNGESKAEDEVILRLSDAFESGTEPDIEVRVTMLNINYGHNKALLEACQPLGEYAFFVDRVREYKKQSGNLKEAIDTALRELNDDAVIKPFLVANRSEVTMMCITEYDEARAFREQREEGFKDGEKQGAWNMLKDLVRKGILTLAQAAGEANMTVEEFQKKAGLDTRACLKNKSCTIIQDDVNQAYGNKEI